MSPDHVAARRDQADMMSELRSMKGLIEERFGALAFMEKLQRQPAQARLTQKLLDCGYSPALIRKLAESLPADVVELLSHGAKMVVLSRGMELKLHIDPATIAMLEQAGVSIHSAETTEAVRIYNLLADSEPVGGLFHSTC